MLRCRQGLARGSSQVHRSGVLTLSIQLPPPRPLAPTCRVAAQNVRRRNSILICTPTAARSGPGQAMGVFGDGVGGWREKTSDLSQREKAHERGRGATSSLQTSFLVGAAAAPDLRPWSLRQAPWEGRSPLSHRERGWISGPPWVVTAPPPRSAPAPQPDL